MTFSGRVLPESAKATIFAPLEVAAKPDPTGSFVGLETSFWFGVKDGQFAVRCQTNRIDDASLRMIHQHAFEIARCAVDMLSFSTGLHLRIIMDKAVNHDGTETAMTYMAPSLARLCTSFRLTPNVFSLNPAMYQSFIVLMQDPAYMLALNDLTSTLGAPYLCRINCARAIEALAVDLSPGDKDQKRRWRKLQSTLNLSEAYTEQLTDDSKGPRHGNYFERALNEDDALREIAWTIMDRFVHYLLRGKTKLPETDFPIL